MAKTLIYAGQKPAQSYIPQMRMSVANRAEGSNEPIGNKDYSSIYGGIVGGADMIGNTLNSGGATTGGNILKGAAAGASLGSAFGPWGTAIGGVVGGIVGIFSPNKKDQKKAQDELMRIQQQYGEEAARMAFERAKEMNLIQYKQNSPAEIKKRLKEAGLNVSVMYGQAGAGMGGAGGNQPQAQAEVGDSSRAGAVPMAHKQMELMNAQEMLMRAQATKEIAEARNYEKTAVKTGAETMTINEMRIPAVSKMIEEGRASFIKNIIEDYKVFGGEEGKGMDTNNGLYNKGGSPSGGGFAYTEIMNQMIKQSNDTMIQAGIITLQDAQRAQMLSQVELNEALTFYNTERGRAIVTELMIAMKNADANMIRANAEKLTSEWNTGELTNWKTQYLIIQDFVKNITDIAPNIIMKR